MVFQKSASQNKDDSVSPSTSYKHSSGHAFTCMCKYAKPCTFPQRLQDVSHLSPYPDDHNMGLLVGRARTQTQIVSSLQEV